MTVGERVEEALEIADMSVKGLQRALQGEGVEGGSYANLHRLKGGKKERPSAELLLAVAEATGVDFTWLVTGEGEPTEARAAARAETEGVSRDSLSTEDARRKHGTLALQHAVLKALGRNSPPPPERPEGLEDPGGDSEAAVEWREDVERSFYSRRIHPWVGPLSEVLRRFGPSSTEPVRLPLGSGVAIEEVAEALAGPLDALGVDTERMGFDEVDDYVAAMVPVLLSLAEAPTRRSPEERLRAARQDLEKAREDGLSGDVVERLEDRVQTLEEEVTQSEE